MYIASTYLDDTMYQHNYKNTFKIHVLKYFINSHTHSIKVLKLFHENVNLRCQSNFRNYDTLFPYFLNKKLLSRLGKADIWFHDKYSKL